MLCHGESYKATIVRKMPVEAPVLLAGGVVRNAGVVRAVRDVFKLDEGDLIADTAGVYVQAAGAAAHAAKGRSCGRTRCFRARRPWQRLPPWRPEVEQEALP